MTAHAYVVKEMHVSVKQGAGAAVDYQCEVTGVQVTPSASSQTISVACPDGVITAPGPTSWAMTVNYTGSLLSSAFWRFMVTNDGLPATVTIEPNPVTEPGYKVVLPVILAAGAIDWTVGAFGNGSATWPMTGKPTFVDGP